MTQHSFTVIRIPETSSTNSAILEMAKKQKLNRLVLAADHQTAGRGQFGRKWLSSPGENLLFSIYFEPQIKPAQASALTGIACEAVMAVLTQAGIQGTIKPPNDILVQGKKICGILTEASSAGEKLEYVVVGIGLNVNSTAETLLPEAISMRLAAGKTFERLELLDLTLKEFENRATSHFSVEFDRLVGRQ